MSQQSEEYAVFPTKKSNDMEVMEANLCTDNIVNLKPKWDFPCAGFQSSTTVVQFTDFA